MTLTKLEIILFLLEMEKQLREERQKLESEERNRIAIKFMKGGIKKGG